MSHALHNVDHRCTARCEILIGPLGPSIAYSVKIKKYILSFIHFEEVNLYVEDSCILEEVNLSERDSSILEEMNLYIEVLYALYKKLCPLIFYSFCIDSKGL